MKLFDAMPAVDETLLREIGAGLGCWLPIALRGSAEARAAAEGSPLAALIDELEDVDVAAMDHVSVRLGAVIIMWDVMRHLSLLRRGRTRLGPGTRAGPRGNTRRVEPVGFLPYVQRLAAEIDDSHASVRHSQLAAERGFLPCRVDEIDGRIVVAASKTAELERGDVVVTIDGEAVANVLCRSEELISGSPPVVTASGPGIPGLGERAPARDAGRASQRRRPHRDRRTVEPAAVGPHGKFEELAEGIVYMDLMQASMDEICARLDTLAEAPGVVFDLRGYPKCRPR